MLPRIQLELFHRAEALANWEAIEPLLKNEPQTENDYVYYAYLLVRARTLPVPVPKADLEPYSKHLYKAYTKSDVAKGEIDKSTSKVLKAIIDEERTKQEAKQQAPLVQKEGLSLEIIMKLSKIYHDHKDKLTPDESKILKAMSERYEKISFIQHVNWKQVLENTEKEIFKGFDYEKFLENFPKRLQQTITTPKQDVKPDTDAKAQSAAAVSVAPKQVLPTLGELEEFKKMSLATTESHDAKPKDFIEILKKLKDFLGIKPNTKDQCLVYVKAALFVKEIVRNIHRKKGAPSFRTMLDNMARKIPIDNIPLHNTYAFYKDHIGNLITAMKDNTEAEALICGSEIMLKMFAAAKATDPQIQSYIAGSQRMKSALAAFEEQPRQPQASHHQRQHHHGHGHHHRGGVIGAALKAKRKPPMEVIEEEPSDDKTEQSTAGKGPQPPH